MCICLIGNIYAQELHSLPPKVSFIDFGFVKPISSAKAYTYEVEGDKKTLIDYKVYKFDKSGNILEDENHLIVGETEYVTIFKYTYKNGALDSLIEIDVNKAINNGKPSIRSIRNFSYNDVDRVLVEKRRAVGGSSGMIYYYFSNGLVTKKIERVKEPGNSHDTKTYYTYDKGQLTAAEDITESGAPQDNGRTYYINGDQIGFHYLTTKEIDLYDADGNSYVFELTGSDKDFMKTYRGHLANPKVDAVKEMAKSNKLLRTSSEKNNYVKDKAGNWTKNLPINSWGQLRATFRELQYADGTKTGDTKFDEAFVKQVQKKKP